MATAKSILDVIRKKKQATQPVNASRVPNYSGTPYSKPEVKESAKVPLIPSPFNKSQTNPYNLVRPLVGQKVPNSSRYSPADDIKPMSTEAGRSTAPVSPTPYGVDTSQVSQKGTFDPYSNTYVTGGPSTQRDTVQSGGETTPSSSFSQQMFKQFSPSQVKQIATDRLSELQKQYASLGAPTEQEKALQNQLTQYVGGINQSIAGMEGQGRGITTGLIRGQQGKLAEQGNLQAQTLQGQLSNEQQARIAQQGAVGTELGFEQDRIAQERLDQQNAQTLQTTMLSSGFRSVDPNSVQQLLASNPSLQAFEIGGQTFVSTPSSGEIKEVGDALVQITPDGQVIELYRAPSSGSGGEGFSLSPGQGRYDAFGNLIAQAPGGATELTQAQQKNAGFLTRAQAAEQDVQSAFGQGLNLAQAPLPNLIQSPAYQRYRQAGEAWIKAILRQESGAAIPPEEINSYFRTYFPTFGDSQSVIQQKQSSRQQAINSLAGQSGQGGGQDDPLGVLGGSSFTNDPSTSQKGSIVNVPLGSRSVQVSSGIADRLARADADYFRATGKHMSISEGLRSNERQKELYARYQSGQGGRAAPPGQSFHETGNAVDVGNNWQAYAPYLRKYGFRNELADDRGHFSIGEFA